MISTTTKLARAVLLALPLSLVAACSGGGGTSSDFETPNGGASDFAVIGCSLGCSNGLSGTQVSCGTLNIFVNQEISVLFSRAVKLSSVTKSTFQVTEVSTGKAPAGSFEIDPSTPGRVIFRPALTFDSSGSPVFGLELGQSYTIRIPGVTVDPPPYIESADGKPNAVRLLCTVAASEGVNDPVPGAPQVDVLVDVVTATDPNGNPTEIAFQQPAAGAVDVFRDSPIRFVFNDVMNPATLVNPITQTSDFLEVAVDPDGNVNDASDQLAIFGSYTIAVDQSALKTTVVFTPSAGFPSAGSQANKRKIVVRVPATVVDLGGNPVQNAGQFTFTPEVLIFAPIVLPTGGEQFVDALNRDDARTGAVWSDVGVLLPGASGGPGYAGDLVVPTGQEVTLCTEAACLSFPTAVNTFQNLDVIPLGAADVVPGEIPQVQITDGQFPFSSVTVRTGGVLRFRGRRPARVFGRGEVLIQGVVDATGSLPPQDTDGTVGQPSNLLDGGAGGPGGPAAGSGGQGADRPNNAGSNLLTLTPPNNGVVNPGAMIDGGEGGGVGGLPGGPGAGPGGVHWPPVLPSSTTDWGVVEFNNVFLCATDMIGASGGGGAYATDGGVGITSPPLLPVPPPALPGPTPGGSSAEVGITPTVMQLDPDAGNLRGGAGGGGGGASVHTTRTSGVFNAIPPCSSDPPGNPPLISEYRSHSGAGGGGGGGAIQVNAGRSVTVDGVVDAGGGGGGSSFGLMVTGQPSTDRSAAPGGGGAGGAILLQSRTLQIAATPGRLDVGGGPGGKGGGNSVGGPGGAGLVRLETITQTLLPTIEAQKISPFSAADPSSSQILSLGTLTAKSTGMAALSGAQSCWMLPQGNFFAVEFAEDEPVGGTLGWNMDLVLNFPGLDPIPFRGPNGILPTSVEELVGSDLLGANASPVVVRFQGARSVAEILDFCELPLSGENSAIAPDSLTGWVRHPAELNTYWDFLGPEEAGGRRSNMIRFQVIFDQSTGLVPNVIQGVTNFRIQAQPD